MGAIVIPRDVYHSRKPICQYTVPLIHAAGHFARGIFAVADVLQAAGHGISVWRTLRGHFITYTPENNARAVAIVAHHVDDVFLSPILEEAVVAVFALCYIPLVERFNHHHEAQRVA